VFTLGQDEELTFTNLPPGNFTIYAAPEHGWALNSVECNIGSPIMARYGAQITVTRNETIHCIFFYHALASLNLVPFGAGSTADPSPGTIYTLRARAFIDGRSSLIIQGNTAYWHHEDGAAPGRHRSAPNGNVPTTLNGIAWFPVWPGDPPGHDPTDPVSNEVRECDCDSLNQYEGVPVLAAAPQTVEMVGIQAREAATIVQQPAAANSYTLIIEFNDNLTPGPTWYEVGLDYLTGTD
jgi:hypothetical protein